jgi:hypothetical protein
MFSNDDLSCACIPWMVFAGTRRDDVTVSITPQRFTVQLDWAGRVLDGPLKKRTKASEACWALDTTTLTLQELQARLPHAAQHAQQKPVTTASDGARCTAGDHAADVAAGRQVFEFVELLVVLVKEEGGHYWRALFEGGEEKSHMQVSGATPGVFCSFGFCSHVLQEALRDEDDAMHSPLLLTSLALRQQRCCSSSNLA